MIHHRDTENTEENEFESLMNASQKDDHENAKEQNKNFIFALSLFRAFVIFFLRVYSRSFAADNSSP